MSLKYFQQNTKDNPVQSGRYRIRNCLISLRLHLKVNEYLSINNRWLSLFQLYYQYQAQYTGHTYRVTTVVKKLT